MPIRSFLGSTRSTLSSQLSGWSVSDPRDRLPLILPSVAAEAPHGRPSGLARGAGRAPSALGPAGPWQPRLAGTCAHPKAVTPSATTFSSCGNLSSDKNGSIRNLGNSISGLAESELNVNRHNGISPILGSGRARQNNVVRVAKFMRFGRSLASSPSRLDMSHAKLILSKKGFDTTYGCGPSPILRVEVNELLGHYGRSPS